MGTQPSIKIRTLPRPDEEAKAATIAVPEAAEPSTRRPLIYLSAVGLLGMMGFMIFTSSPRPKHAGVHQQKDLSSLKPQPGSDKVTKYLQDAQLKSQMMAKARQLENMDFRKSGESFESEEASGESKNYGVQMDMEDTASKVFEDLHDQYQPTDLLPGDKINARLDKNRWTNEFERRERVTFVREFIRSAYEKGYEVQIDQNLVVVGVKKITNQKVSIDQVLSKLAKQGL